LIWSRRSQASANITEANVVAAKFEALLGGGETTDGELLATPSSISVSGEWTTFGLLAGGRAITVLVTRLNHASSVERSIDAVNITVNDDVTSHDDTKAWQTIEAAHVIDVVGEVTRVLVLEVGIDGEITVDEQCGATRRDRFRTGAWRIPRRPQSIPA
jgi:hypothetical protein